MLAVGWLWMSAHTPLHRSQPALVFCQPMQITMHSIISVHPLNNDIHTNTVTQAFLIINMSGSLLHSLFLKQMFPFPLPYFHVIYFNPLWSFRDFSSYFMVISTIGWPITCSAILWNKLAGDRSMRGEIKALSIVLLSLYTITEVTINNLNISMEHHSFLCGYCRYYADDSIFLKSITRCY